MRLFAELLLLLPLFFLLCFFAEFFATSWNFHRIFVPSRSHLMRLINGSLLDIVIQLKIDSNNLLLLQISRRCLRIWKCVNWTFLLTAAAAACIGQKQIENSSDFSLRSPPYAALLHLELRIYKRKTNTVDRELPLNFMRNTPRSSTSDVCHKILAKNVKCSTSPSTLNEHFSWTLHVLVVSFITLRAATEDRGNELFNFLCRHGIRLVDEKKKFLSVIIFGRAIRFAHSFVRWRREFWFLLRLRLDACDREGQSWSNLSHFLN